jgi:hypothetical protein
MEKNDKRISVFNEFPSLKTKRKKAGNRSQAQGGRP